MGNMKVIKKKKVVMIPDPIRIRKYEIRAYIDKYLMFTQEDSL